MFQFSESKLALSRFRLFEFGYWDLFVICDLEFVILGLEER